MTKRLLLSLLLTQAAFACPDFRTSRHWGCTGEGCLTCKEAARPTPAPPVLPRPGKINGKTGKADPFAVKPAPSSSGLPRR